MGRLRFTVLQDVAEGVEWSRSIVTVIFYLEETDLDNGCTEVIPGTHLLPGVEVLHKIDETEWIAATGVLDQRVYRSNDAAPPATTS